MRYDDKNTVPILTFDALSELNQVKHGFTTRLGGVSTGNIQTKSFLDKHNSHFQLDLWKSIQITLEEAGVSSSHIHTTDICTCENPDLLFSPRASHGRRGVQGAFIMLTCRG